MRVLVISDMYPNFMNEALGIFVEEQVRELIRQGCEVKVVAPVPYSPFPFNKITERWQQYSAIPLQESRNEVEVYHPRYIASPQSLIGDTLLPFHGWWMYRGIKSVVLKHLENFRPQVIHAHAAFPAGYAVALLRKDLKSVKIVVTTHGGDININPFKSQRVMKRTQFALNNFDIIIAVSRKLKHIISSISSRAQCSVIPNGVDVHKFTIADSDVKWIEEKRNEFNKSKILLFVGNVTEGKGVRELLDAFRDISSSREALILIIVGKVMMRKHLNQYISNHSLSDKIKIVGSVPHEQIKLWMNLCDIFILPSHSEGLPVAMLEAMACSKPVIISEVGGVNEVVQNRKNGLLIPPKNVKFLTKTINFLLDNPGIAEEIGKNAKKTIIENYTWAKNAEKTIQIYEKVLKNSK